MPTNLSPWQQYLSQIFPGKNARIDPARFEQAANQFFGQIPIPPGSQVISQSAGEARYIDAEGYEHVLRRSLNGTDPNVGQVQEISNRPAVLPVQQPAQLSADLDAIRQLVARLQAAPGFAPLSPETQGALDTQNAAERAQLDEALSRQQGQLVAGLYANRVNQSSIANQAAAEFQRSSGLVRQQQSADAALRSLQTQLYMTDQERQRLNTAIAGLTQATGQQIDILGQQTQKDIAGAGIDLSRDQLAESARQANLNFELGQQNADMQLAEQNSLLNKFLKGSQVVANVAGAASGGISAWKALTGGGKK